MRLQVIQDWIGKEILSADQLCSELKEEAKTNNLKKKGLLERTKQQLYVCGEKQKLLKKMLDETKSQEGKMWGHQVETEFQMEFRKRMSEDIGEQGRNKVDQELGKAMNNSQKMIEELLGNEWTLASIDEVPEEPGPPPISMVQASEMDMPLDEPLYEEEKDKKKTEKEVPYDAWYCEPSTKEKKEEPQP